MGRWGSELVLGAVLWAGLACGRAETLPGNVAVEDAEAEALRGTVALGKIAPSEHAVLRIEPGHRRRGFVFEGERGARISLYADGQQGFDPVLRLYTYSAARQRPVGRPLASNDDTARSDWTLDPRSASIDSYALPETGRYALVVEACDRASVGSAVVWFDLDLPDPATPLPFAGTGPSRPLGFQGVQATSQPISEEISTLLQRASGTNRFVAARVAIDPAALQAILGDPARLGTLGFDALYRASDPPVPGPVVGAPGTAQVAAVSGAEALQVLQASTVVPLAEATRVHQAEQLLVNAMLGDGPFAAGTSSTYRLHWDNADDASADGLLAVDAASGEVRVVAYAVVP